MYKPTASIGGGSMFSFRETWNGIWGGQNMPSADPCSTRRWVVSWIWASCIAISLYCELWEWADTWRTYEEIDLGEKRKFTNIFVQMEPAVRMTCLVRRVSLERSFSYRSELVSTWPNRWYMETIERFDASPPPWPIQEEKCPSENATCDVDLSVRKSKHLRIPRHLVYWAMILELRKSDESTNPDFGEIPRSCRIQWRYNMCNKVRSPQSLYKKVDADPKD